MSLPGALDGLRSLGTEADSLRGLGHMTKNGEPGESGQCKFYTPLCNSYTPGVDTKYPVVLPVDDRLGVVVEARALVHRLSVEACWGPAPVWRILHHMEERFDLEIERLLRAPVESGTGLEAGAMLLPCGHREDEHPDSTCDGLPPVTLTQAVRVAAARRENPCCTLRRKTSTDEWRVNLGRTWGGSEATAVYETDLLGAIGTMRAMQARAVPMTRADAGLLEFERQRVRDARELTDLDSRISGLHFEDEGDERHDSDR